MEVRSQALPLALAEVQRLQPRRVVIDGPPGLSAMTQSIVECSDLVIIPLRPAQPDLWALPWLAALIAKQRRERGGPQARVIFTQRRDEDLAPLARGIRTDWGLDVHPEPVPWDEAFPGLFEGRALPAALELLVLRGVGLDPDRR